MKRVPGWQRKPVPGPEQTRERSGLKNGNRKPQERECHQETGFVFGHFENVYIYDLRVYVSELVIATQKTKQKKQTKQKQKVSTNSRKKKKGNVITVYSVAKL